MLAGGINAESVVDLGPQETRGERTKDKSGCPYYDCKNEVVALMDEESLKLHIFCEHFFVIIGLNAWIISRVGVEWSVRTSERSEWK